MKLLAASPRLRIFTLLCAAMNTFLACVFQLLVIYRLGIGEGSDVYYGTTIAIISVFTLLLDPLTNILVPMFVERDTRENKAELFCNAMIIAVAGGALISLVSYIPIRIAFPFIFRGLAGASAHQIGGMLAAYSIYLTLYSAITVKNCYLFASSKPIAAQLNMLVSWMVSLLLLYRLEIGSDVSRIADCLIAGSVVGLSLPNIGRISFVFRPKQFRVDLVTLIRRGALLVSGSAVFKAESLMDGAIASFFGAGSLTIYQLFSRMLLSVSTIINSGYIQPITNHLAEAAKDGRWNSLERQAKKAAFWTSVISVACLFPIIPVLLFLHAKPVRALAIYVGLFERHWTVFALMLGYLVGSVIWKVYATGLIVLRREQSFAVICVLTFAFGILLKVSGAYLAGLPGLASGTSVYWLLGAAVMAMSFWEAVKANRNGPRNTGVGVEMQQEMILKAGEAD